MIEKKVTIRILRYRPGHIASSGFMDYPLAVRNDATVLDCLDMIRMHHDATLMYRHSCHHSSCGTCAMRINGSERLACMTKVRDLDGDVITLEPLLGLKCVGDLVVDMEIFFRRMPQRWGYIRESKRDLPEGAPCGHENAERFEDCIECGICYSACPVIRKETSFMGPAALAAVRAELDKAPDRRDDLLAFAGNDGGEHLCERALECSRLCPMHVYPARKIMDLRRMIENKTVSD